MFSQLTRYASEFEVQIDRAELDLRSEYDTRGKMMLGDYSPAALQVTYRWDIDSPSPRAKVQEVIEWIDRGCHTLNSLRQPVPVVGRARVNGAETPFEQQPLSPSPLKARVDDDL